jgi:AcrR family transcriptional regulator
MRKGAETRERICEIAERNILQKGFSATSIDEIIFEAGITKNGFFYHFPDKLHLAKALLTRYIDRDNEFFEVLFARADELSDDPLQRVLIFLKLFAEAIEEMESSHPGCLIAAYCYQDLQFDDEVRRMNAEAMLAWRRMFRARFEEVAAKYPPKATLDLDDLADMVSTLLEGGIVMAKALQDSGLIARQAMLYREFIKIAFA